MIGSNGSSWSALDLSTCVLKWLVSWDLKCFSTCILKQLVSWDLKCFWLFNYVIPFNHVGYLTGFAPCSMSTAIWSQTWTYINCDYDLRHLKECAFNLKITFSLWCRFSIRWWQWQWQQHWSSHSFYWCPWLDGLVPGVVVGVGINSSDCCYLESVLCILRLMILTYGVARWWIGDAIAVYSYIYNQHSFCCVSEVVSGQSLCSWIWISHCFICWSRAPSFDSCWLPAPDHIGMVLVSSYRHTVLQFFIIRLIVLH